MNKSILIIIGIVVLAGAGWYLWSRSAPKPSQIEEGVGKVGEVEETSKVTVNIAEQNSSGEFGTAILTEIYGKVQVVLNLTGAPQDAAQPAHVHTNSCANIGGVAYPLEFPVNGSSETTLQVSMNDLRGKLPLSINVHKSPEEASVYVACGDLLL